MSELFKEKIMNDINDIPVYLLPKFYKFLHLLKTELLSTTHKTQNRGSLKGIWKGSEIDDHLVDEAKRSLFGYE